MSTVNSPIRLYAPRVTPVRAIRLLPDTVDVVAEWVMGLKTSDMNAIKMKNSQLVYWVDARARRFAGFADTLLFMPYRHPDGVTVGGKFISLPVAEYVPVREGAWLVATDDWFVIRSNRAFTRDFIETGEDNNG